MCIRDRHDSHRVPECFVSSVRLDTKDNTSKELKIQKIQYGDILQLWNLAAVKNDFSLSKIGDVIGLPLLNSGPEY